LDLAHLIGPAFPADAILEQIIVAVTAD